MTTYTLQILPGDGIGSEIINETRKVIGWINENTDITIDTKDGLIGGQSYDAYSVPLSDETLEQCRAADAILMGSVGGPKWDGVDYNKRPEAGLLRLRKELDLFANLRPALVFDALIDASTLKPEIVRGLDILIVRELTGGVYFGEPRGIEDLGSGQRRGYNTQTYTTAEIQRVARVAFELARKRNILSDEAAMLTGSLGMLPSASLGAPGSTALYEPVHGSAPDIAGQGKANPLATILSFAMCLRYSFDQGNLADKIENAVQSVLNAGTRTPDIMAQGCTEVSTSAMGDAIITALKK